jgi:uncharacterized membrane protein (DUF106 family)
MNKINQFFKDHGSKVITVLLILLYFKSCGVDRELGRLKKEAKANTDLIMKLPSANDLKIEGLNAEKRMIQATDRKMLDVQRQNTIEKEIKILEGK